EQTRAIAEVLVKHGLWEATEGGYMIHDWLDYNPPKVELDALSAVRSEAAKEGNRKRWAGHQSQVQSQMRSQMDRHTYTDRHNNHEVKAHSPAGDGQAHGTTNQGTTTSTWWGDTEIPFGHLQGRHFEDCTREDLECLLLWPKLRDNQFRTRLMEYLGWSEVDVQ